jgi:hypothetical protein
MLAVEEDDEDEPDLVLLVVGGFEEDEDVLPEFVAEDAFLVDVDFCLVVLLEFAGRCLLDEFPSNLCVQFDLLLALAQLVEIVVFLLLAHELDLDEVEFFFEGELANGEVAAFGPNVIVEVDLDVAVFALAPQDLLAARGESVDRLDEAGVGDGVVEHREVVGFAVVEEDNVMGLFMADQLALFPEGLALQQPFPDEGDLLLLPAAVDEDGLVPVSGQRYFSTEMRLMISLLFSVTARLRPRVWKPRQEYSTLLILVREAGLFLARFLAKVDMMCACGSLEKWITTEL